MPLSLRGHAPLRFLVLTFMLACCLRLAGGAPEYSISGKAPELETTVLAKTAEGPITSLDALMFDAMSHGLLTAVPMDAMTSPTSLAAEPYLDRIEAVVMEMAVSRALARQAGGWQPPEDEVQVKAFGATIAAWVEAVIRPQVEVETADIHRYYLAHPERYLKRRQVQVRYIFVRLGEDVDIQAYREHYEELERLAMQVREGIIDFAEAARRVSDAESAEQGGLLPPFYDGTYFQEFENQAFVLDEPGQVSGVFEGPGGLYLLQLVERRPARNIPISEVSDQIREELEDEQIRHYFDYQVGKLTEETAVNDFSHYWDFLHHEAPIARVGAHELKRDQFLRYYPDPTEPDYQVRWDIIRNNTREWIEGRLVNDAVNQRGLGEHPWIQRARYWAGIVMRRGEVYRTAIDPGLYATNEAALQTLKTHQDFLDNLYEYRLIRFRIEPEFDRDMADWERLAARRLTERIERQLTEGLIPVEPVPVQLNEWAKQIEANNEQSLNEKLNELRQVVGATPWVGVRYRVEDAGWQTPAPGTPLRQLLSGVKLGQLSAPSKLGDQVTYYLPLWRRPVDVEPWLDQSLMLQTLAFEAEAGEVYAEQLAQLEQQGQIEFEIPTAVPSRERYIRGETLAVPAAQ